MSRGLLQKALLCVLAGIALGAPVGGMTRAARADEFATVPAGDALYRHLNAVADAGWLSAAGAASDKRTSRGAASMLTRYEMALQTAEAIFTVTARYNADPQWGVVASRPALRALRDLTAALRAELTSLGVDAATSLRLCDRLLHMPAAATSTVPSAQGAPAASTPLVATSSDAMPIPAAGDASRSSMGQGPGGARGLLMSLSQRLRVDAALSALARDSADPFGDWTAAARPGGAGSLPGSTPGGAGNGFSRSAATTGAMDGMTANSNASAAGVGLAFDVTGRLTLRAGFRQTPSSPLSPSQSMSLQNPWMAGAGPGRAFNGAVDVTLPRGLLLSSSVENVVPDAADASSWTRLSGGLGLSAWQNRLSLAANLSRLTPEDARLLPSTVGGLNLGLNVSERLSLNLIYQQLFSAPTTERADRMVAGGISIKF